MLLWRRNCFYKANIPDGFRAIRQQDENTVELNFTTSELRKALKKSDVLNAARNSAASFPELLDRAGFHIRGRRADCPHCQAEGHGHGRGTVAFTSEVAFCHRCKWTANVRTLSRALGVPVAPEVREQRVQRERAARFSAWLDTCHLILVKLLRRLTERAELAKNVLARFPDSEPAWAALADLYHNEASLLGALDLLAFEKLSPWLEQPMTRECLAVAFGEAEARTHEEVLMSIDPNIAAKKLVTEAARIAGLQVVDVAEPSDWPREMAREAFIGLAGDFVRLVEPHTEADPVALLTNFMVGGGVLFGREAYAIADGRTHYPVEFLLVAGQTGAGRKGTASARTLPVMERVEEGFSSQRVLSGLSSGEGLIKGISPKDGEIVVEADGVRRYLALLPEFASLLSVMRREGNTMSAILREAWDGTRLRVLTRKEPLDVDNVNLSVIAHITPEELLNNLTATDRANGFANRFLILLVRRSKFLPEGGGEINLNGIVTRLRSAVQAAKGRGRIQRDDAACELWKDEYRRISQGRDGLHGALCGRAEAHVLRLSLIYALFDLSSTIRREHLQAALAVWDYCERSIEHIFGRTSGDADRERILGALISGPLTITELFRVFSNNRDRDWIKAKMAMLVRDGSVVPTFKEGDRKGSIAAWTLKRRMPK